MRIRPWEYKYSLFKHTRSTVYRIDYGDPIMLYKTLTKI